MIQSVSEQNAFIIFFPVFPMLIAIAGIEQSYYLNDEF